MFSVHPRLGHESGQDLGPRFQGQARLLQSTFSRGSGIRQSQVLQDAVRDSSSTTRVSAGSKRGRGAWGASAAPESDDGDSAGDGDQLSSSRPKKRFIWPEELHRDFIAAVFDMGLKKADPSRLKDLLPKKERAADAEAMKSCLQKLRSFRYQMRSALGGDNLDTPEELAQKGIVPNGGIGLSLGHHRNGSISLTTGLSGDEDGVKMEMADLSESFEVPPELAGAIERLDNKKTRRIVELMGQCVQVQKSAHGILMNAFEAQEVLKVAIMDKVRDMGLPVSEVGDKRTLNEAPARALNTSEATGRSAAATLAPRARPTVYVKAKGEKPWVYAGKPTQGAPSEGIVTSKDSAGAKSALGANPAGNGAGGGLGSSGGFSDKTPAASTVPARVLQTTPNLFSFVSAGAKASTGAAATGSSSAAASSSAAGFGASEPNSSSRPLRLATGAGTVTSPPPAPPPLLAASSSAAAPSTVTATTSSREPGGPSFDHVDWEAGVLLGGQEEVDEASLRMEMKTSMDIHRLMRSRQKNQLQLHPRHDEQNEHQQRQQHTNGELQRGKGSERIGRGAAQSDVRMAPSSSMGGETSLQSVEATPTKGGASELADAGAWANGSGASSASSAAATTREGRSAPATASKARGTEAPVSSADDSGTGMRDDGGRGDSVGAAQEAGGASSLDGDLDAPPLVTSDWNWDEDVLDAQLFSFLLDGAAPS